MSEMDDRDNHITYPDRLAIILNEAGVEFYCDPTPQIGELQIIARLAADDGCLDIEELNQAAFTAVLRIAQAVLRFGSNELRGILADEWRDLSARADAAEAEVARLKGEPAAAEGDAERLYELAAALLSEAIERNRLECQANCRILSDGPDGIRTASDLCPDCDRTWVCDFADAVNARRTVLAAHQARVKEVEDNLGSVRPTIVCLCGSTRFMDAFFEAGWQETLAGKMVLSVGVCQHAEHHGAEALGPEVVERLDELHLRKIDLADEVLILNVGGYIGESTGRDLAYAREQGKLVRFLEPEL